MVDKFDFCFLFRRERRKRKEEAKAKEANETEVIDAGIEVLKEEGKKLDEDSKSSDGQLETAENPEKLKETTFEKPTVEEIKQLQEEPKQPKDKKTD